MAQSLASMYTAVETGGELDQCAIFRIDRSQYRIGSSIYNKIIKTKSQDLEGRCTPSVLRIATISALPQTHHTCTPDVNRTRRSVPEVVRADIALT
jgi:hypothetical protein